MDKFPHIGSLKHVINYVNKCNLSIDPTHQVGKVVYRGTVKLHGTNAGVRVAPNGECTPQSRNRSLSVDNDNLGFAAFMAGEDQQPIMVETANTIRGWVKAAEQTPITIYGEWVGRGIQKGVGVSQLEKKQFVIFGARIGDDGYVVTPDFIPKLDVNCWQHGIYSVTNLENWNLFYQVDFTDESIVNAFAEYVKEKTIEVEEKCPWASLFGIQGVGEGLVQSL